MRTTWVLILSLLGCGPSTPASMLVPGTSAPSPDGGGATDPEPGTFSPSPVPGTFSPSPEPGTFSPSPVPGTQAYLHLTQERLATLKAGLATNGAWTQLKQTVDTYRDAADDVRNVAESSALVYLLTGDAGYCQSAMTKAEEHINRLWDFGQSHLREDYYYAVGDYVRPAAITLNYCQAVLTAAQVTFLATFIDNVLDENWFHRQSNVGWGVDDPGSNFFHASLQASAEGGYALKAINHPNADVYLKLLHEKIAMALPYLSGTLSSGDFFEGTNYGQRSRQRLAGALSAVASMELINYFTASPFFPNAIQFVTYQAQPEKRVLYVSGDMARSGREYSAGDDREAIQTFVFFLPDSEARQRGQWYLNHLATSYLAGSYGSYNDWGALWKDVVFGLSLPESAPSSLPLSYETAGTRWATFRSDWGDDATSLVISGSRSVVESHQHDDTGSFQLWKKDWQAGDIEAWEVDGTAVGDSTGNPAAHSMIVADQHDHQYPVAESGGLTARADFADLGYARVDATNTALNRPDSQTYNYLFNEWTRELVFLRPSTLIVYDRVDGKPGTTYHNRVHTPGAQTHSGSSWTSSFGGGSLAIVPLAGGAVSSQMEQDSRGRSCYRYQQEMTGAVSRFMNVLKVFAGPPGSLEATRVISSTGEMEGALTEGQVVLFSSKARGEAAALPFSYSVPTSAAQHHTLLDMTGSVSVDTTASGGTTTVTVRAGANLPADAHGIVRFVLP